MRIGSGLSCERRDDIRVFGCEHAAVARLPRFMCAMRAVARQRRDRALRIARGGRDERRVAGEPRARGVGVEAVGRIRGDQFDAARIVGEIEREIEARGEVRPRRRDRGRARQRAVEPRIELLRELDAQPFVAAPHRRLHRVDDALERHVLVRIRIERRRAHRVDQRGERLCRRDAHAQRDGVQEQPEQRARFRALPVRDRHRDHHVGRAGQARQPRVERGHQHREDRRVRIAREPAHVGRDRIGQAQRRARAVQRARRARLPVDRQRERARRVLQRGAPVVQLPLALAACEHVALPVRIVRVLDRQRGQRRRDAVRIRAIGRRQLVERAARAPAVGDRVMGGQQQPVAAVGERDERRAHERAFGEVERRAGVALGEDRRLRVAAGRRQAAQVDFGDRHRQARVDPLHHDAVVVFDERRAPRVVPADHVIERALQRGAVERAVDRPVRGDVIGRTRVARLREHPEALLRQRRRALRIRCAGRRAGARRDRDERCAGFALRAVDRVGQCGERRVREQHVEPQVDAPFGTNCSLQLHRRERIAAQREEPVVARRRRVEAEQRLPDFSGAPLGVRARRVAGCAARAVRTVRGDPLAQRRAVELAVQRVRQRVAAHVPVRLPGSRQLRGDVRLQRRVVGLRAQRDARDEPRRAAVGFRDHRRIGDGRMRAQACGDFRRLDAHAAHLHLIVEAAEVIECAVVAHPREVAGAIDARAGRAVRIGHEALGGQRRAAVIAARETDAAEQQLARRAIIATVATVDAGNPRTDRPADRQRRERVVRGERGRLARLDRPQHRRDHRFGRPVAVDEPHRRKGVAHELERLLRQRLAAEREHAQRGRHAVARGERRELAQVGRRKRGDADLLAHHQRMRGVRRERLRRRDRDARADRERREPAFVRGVEIDRREMQQPVAGLDRQRGRERIAMRSERPVLDDDRLRLAGRARRVDHVGGRARMDRCVVFSGICVRWVRCFGIDVRDVERMRERRAERRAPRGVDDAVAQVRVAHDPVEACGRMARIERHEHAARLQHGQQRDEQLARALDAHADPHLGADARRAQPPREPRRARIERAARQADFSRKGDGERGRVGRAARQLADSVMQRSRETRHGREVLQVRPLRPTHGAALGGFTGVTNGAAGFLPFCARSADD
ncbi:hypothetical protein BUB20358_05829 [Burkholderia ubonensis]|nr:hypothetical protein BUB20358_05829 [Burkholderia ubonensis]